MNKTLRYIGTLAATTICLFLAHRLYTTVDTVSPHLRTVSLLIISYAVAMYMAGMLALAMTWPVLLRLSGTTHANIPTLAAVHLRTQAGKYLPGGFLHFAFRHWAGREFGISHLTLSRATIGESCGLLICALAISAGLLFDPQTPSIKRFIDLHLLYIIALVILSTGAITIAWRVRLHSRDSKLFKTTAPDAIRLGWVILLNTLFFSTSGFALFILIQSQGTSVHYINVTMWWAAAWMIGYATPGAPAGIGIRDGVLVYGLKLYVTEPTALAAVLIFRLVTILGDLIASFAAHLYIRMPRKG